MVIGLKNIKIRDINLIDDIDLAKKIISGKLVPKDYSYNDHSMIYKTTNETISNESYFSYFKNRDRVLSITSSGDQIINSILAGAKEIVGIDISRFPKYFFALKIAAIKSLDEEEFIRFILGNKNTEYSFSNELYLKIRKNLSDEVKYFWDSIFSSFSTQQIEKSSFFGNYSVSHSVMKKNNPYLQNDNYEIIRKKIDSIDIELLDTNIFELKKNEFDNFDLIILTSLINYVAPIGSSEGKKAEEYRNFVKKLPLNQDGVALVYNFAFDGFLYPYFNDKNFKTLKIKEEVHMLPIDNELIVYTKPKKKILSIFGKK